MMRSIGSDNFDGTYNNDIINRLPRGMTPRNSTYTRIVLSGFWRVATSLWSFLVSGLEQCRTTVKLFAGELAMILLELRRIQTGVLQQDEIFSNLVTRVLKKDSSRFMGG